MDNIVYAATVDLDLGNKTTYEIGSTFPNELITQTSHTFQLTLNDSGVAYDISGMTASTVKIKKNDSTASATTLATGTLTTDGTDGRIDFVINKDLIPASLAAFPQSPNRPVVLYYITIEDADSKIQVRKLITVYDIDGTGTASANPEAADFEYTPTTAGDWTPWTSSGNAPALVGTALDDTAEWINDTGLGKLDKSGGTMTGILREAKGADVASATALTLGTDGNFFDITGTTTITSIATLGVGSQVTLQFDGALILTHHATDLILQGSNITTVAGDTATFVEYATGDWIMLNYRRADGSINPSGIYLGGTASNNLLNSFDETDFTPTLNNVTLGNGSVWGKYTEINGMLFVRGGLLFGTTTSITGNVSISSLPETSVNEASARYMLSVICRDVSSGIDWPAYAPVLNNSTSTGSVRKGTDAGVISSTAPFTWASTDALTFTGLIPIN